MEGGRASTMEGRASITEAVRASTVMGDVCGNESPRPDQKRGSSVLPTDLRNIAALIQINGAAAFPGYWYRPKARNLRPQ
jgi:hypothetical protein